MIQLESRAKALAIKFHAGQTRKANGAPYSEHLAEVVDLLKHVANVDDEKVIAAGWLHDALEDTDCSRSDIADNCGEEVLELVISLTDDKTKPLSERRASVLKKLEDAPESIRLLKLADITSNVALLPSDWSNEKTMSYLKWLDEVALACSSASGLLYERYLSLRHQYF
jgi:guanosine-3',5'-bis(diphosphate) 3'-pyrophosphohydrolase